MRGFQSFVRAWGVGVLVAVSGCGDSGAGGGPTGPIPAEEGPAALARAVCRLTLETCGCQLPGGVELSVETCESFYASQLTTQFAEAQAAGLTYSPECMGEYIDLLEDTVGCKTLSELTLEVQQQLDTPACKVHSGPGVAGEPCVFNYQAYGDSCAQGLQCNGLECIELPPAPTRRREGEACEFVVDDCEPGTACAPAADDPLGPTTCVRLSGAGESCGVGCAEGLYCLFPPDGASRCEPLPAEGEPCAPWNPPCAAQLQCDAQQICAAIGLPQGASCSLGGEPCGFGLQCTELVEDAGRTCEPEQALVCGY